MKPLPPRAKIKTQLFEVRWWTIQTCYHLMNEHVKSWTANGSSSRRCKCNHICGCEPPVMCELPEKHCHPWHSSHRVYFAKEATPPRVVLIPESSRKLAVIKWIHIWMPTTKKTVQYPSLCHLHTNQTSKLVDWLTKSIDWLLEIDFRCNTTVGRVHGVSANVIIIVHLRQHVALNCMFRS